MFKKGFLILLTIFLGVLPLEAADTSMGSERQSSLPNVEDIVFRMVAQSQWQEKALREYKALRRFQAANLRFKSESSLDVLTTYHQPDAYESRILRQEGSKFIRERVFDKILEAENETKSRKVKNPNDILPENYDFAFVGAEDCQGRSCYHLTIKPRRKSKYLLNGSIWVDAEDFGIARVHGSPSKRVSFWTLKTEIDRQYKRVGGLWLAGKETGN